MNNRRSNYDLAHDVQSFINHNLPSDFGVKPSKFQENPIWQKFRQQGTDLWLDSGNMDEIKDNWTDEFTSLTTNNTLLNREIQKGNYDSLIEQFIHFLENYDNLTEYQKMLETAFMLNCHHALRLVDKFGAKVSVEEHTDLASRVDQAVEYGRRFHRISPTNFYIKIPFCPAGLLAARRLSDDGIPVNHTLGFSARQNYVMARIARPAFVNVFLGRLNSFIADNDLGNGNKVGQKATLASQAAITRLRHIPFISTKQIAASLRSADQVFDLAGVDVITVPPKVASEVLGIDPDLDVISDKTFANYIPEVRRDLDRKSYRLSTLWLIPNDLIKCLDDLDKEDIYKFSPQDLIDFFADHNCSDVLVDWTKEQHQMSRKEGKIPQLQNWRELLEHKIIGLDSLMNLAGLNSFAVDQKDMDERIKDIMHKMMVHR